METTRLLPTGIPHRSIPDEYIRPESDRPKLSLVTLCQDVPVVDLGAGCLYQIIQQIGRACSLYGFFQEVNHGVPEKVVEDMVSVADEFFKLPEEEKMKLYSDDPSRTTRLSTSFNVRKEEVHNWRDYLRLHCWPLDHYVNEWPSNPPSFKEVVSTYAKQVRMLGVRLYDLISENLGLDKGYIANVPGDQGQHMAINYYPPCPEPDLTYGLPAHTDPNALTILLQDSQVCGLHVLKDGQRDPVIPLPNDFVINIGDKLNDTSSTPTEIKCNWPNPRVLRLCREVVSTFAKQVRMLGIRLYDLISENLGLDKGYIANVPGDQGQHMAINVLGDEGWCGVGFYWLVANGGEFE